MHKSLHIHAFGSIKVAQKSAKKRKSEKVAQKRDKKVLRRQKAAIKWLKTSALQLFLKKLVGLERILSYH